MTLAAPVDQRIISGHSYLGLLVVPAGSWNRAEDSGTWFTRSVNDQLLRSFQCTLAQVPRKAEKMEGANQNPDSRSTPEKGNKVLRK